MRSWVGVFENVFLTSQSKKQIVFPGDQVMDHIDILVSLAFAPCSLYSSLTEVYILAKQ